MQCKILLLDINGLKQATLQGLTECDRTDREIMRSTETEQRQCWKVLQTCFVEDEVRNSSGRTKCSYQPSNTRCHNTNKVVVLSNLERKCRELSICARSWIWTVLRASIWVAMENYSSRIGSPAVPDPTDWVWNFLIGFKSGPGHSSRMSDL